MIQILIETENISDVQGCIDTVTNWVRMKQEAGQQVNRLTVMCWGVRSGEQSYTVLEHHNPEHDWNGSYRTDTTTHHGVDIRNQLEAYSRFRNQLEHEPEQEPG
jgi:hypothetical protein